MTTVTYLSKDQNLADESTTHWFNIDGEVWGVVEYCGESSIVDCDGCPGNESTEIERALTGAVTDEMRME